MSIVSNSSAVSPSAAGRSNDALRQLSTSLPRRNGTQASQDQTSGGLVLGLIPVVPSSAGAGLEVGQRVLPPARAEIPAPGDCDQCDVLYKAPDKSTLLHVGAVLAHLSQGHGYQPGQNS